MKKIKKSKAKEQEEDIKAGSKRLLISVHTLSYILSPKLPAFLSSKTTAVFYLLGLDTEPNGMHF